LYAACFDANGWIFEPLLTKEDAIISDQLNHASIIDGVRLCKAARYRFNHNDMVDLEEKLKESQWNRFRVIVTDAVFSMDWDMAKLDEICDLADKYNALVMADECHSSWFIWKTWRGVVEYCDVMWRVDIITWTLWKALWGALWWYTTGRKEIIEMLRQKSRPYLFSNSLSPSIVWAWLKVFDMIMDDTSFRDKLLDNVDYFKNLLSKYWFDLKPSNSAIIALMLYDAKLAQEFARKLLDEWIYVIW
jgi:glycine C-acetyltransferase